MNLGINDSGTVSEFAMRPGWHAGSLPSMRQIGKGKDRNLRDDRFVWVEGEVPADIDYQEEANGNPFKDIPTHIPEDGFYMKATNANKTASQADRIGWYVAGAFKANRIISDVEARNVITKWNKEHPDQPVEYDFERESGKDFNAEAMQLEDRPTTRFSKREREDIGEYPVTNTIIDSTKDKGIPTNRADALNLFPENGGMRLLNYDQNVHMNVSRSTVKHSALHDEKHVYQAFGKIREIVGNAVKIGEIPVAEDETKTTNSVSVYYAPINIDGTQYSARLLVKELKNRGVVIEDLSLYNVGMHKETPSNTGLNSPETGLGSYSEDVQIGYKVKELIHKTQEKDKELMGFNKDYKTNFRSRDGENSVEADFRRKEEAGRKLAKKLNSDFEAVTELDTSATQEASDGYLVNELGLEKKNGHIYLFLPDNNHQ